MKQTAILLSLFVILASCEPTSKITSSWKKGKFRKTYTNILIAALTSSIEDKTNIENDLEAVLKSGGVIASKSLDLFPPNFTKEINKADILKKTRKTSSQAILTVSLIRKELSPQYVEGGLGNSSMTSYYGRSWGYYNYWTPTGYNPGFYRQDQTYYLETNVYDVKTGELVWSAQSETYNPENLNGFSNELAKLIVEKLSKDGVLRSGIKFEKQDRAVTSRNKH